MNEYQWQYSPADDIDKNFLERLRSFPRKPDVSVYLFRSFFAFLLRFWLRAYHRMRIEGLENLPRDRSFVLVANHSSHLDALCLLSLFPVSKIHRVFPVAAMDYFFSSPPRTFFSSVFINALPFGRYSNTRQSLSVCSEVLGNPGNVLIIFPEGTRSVKGELGDFKPGVGFLLSATKVPAVPCVIEGAFQALPKNRSFPLPKPITVKVGKPLLFKHTDGDGLAREISSQLKSAVGSLRSETV